MDRLFSFLFNLFSDFCDFSSQHSFSSAALVQVSFVLSCQDYVSLNSSLFTEDQKFKLASVIDLLDFGGDPEEVRNLKQGYHRVQIVKQRSLVPKNVDFSSVFSYNALEISRQLTIMDWELFAKIKPCDVFNQK